MAGKPVGTIFVELDMDQTKYTKAQQGILQSASTTALNVEKNWKILGEKSDVMYNAMRQSAINAYDMIKNKAGTSAAEIIRAEEAKNSRIKSLNEQQFGAQTSFLDTIKANWIAVSVAIYAAWSLIGKAFDLAEAGAKVKSIEESFSIIAKSSGIAADTLIANLKRVTNATIDDSDLMIKANRMMIEGFSEIQVTQIGEAARMAARIMGTDVASAYDQISDAVVNLREKGLKTAGFVIDFTAAYEKHAAQLGVTKEQLNEYGKQMAIVDALHEKYLERLKQMGSLEESAYERIQQQKSLWKELYEAITKASAALWDYVAAGQRELELGEALQAYYGVGKGTTAKMVGGEKVYDLYGGTSLGTKIGEKSQITIGTLSSEEIDKTILSVKKLKAEAELLSAAGKMPDWREFLENNLPKGRATIDGVTYSLKELGDEVDAGKAAYERFAETAYPSMEELSKNTDIAKKDFEELNKKLSETKSAIEAMDWESVASGMTELSSDTERLINTLNSENTKSAWDSLISGLEDYKDNVGDIYQQIKDGSYDLAKGMESSLSGFFQSIFDNTKSWSEKMKSLFTGLANSFIKAISDMAAKAVLSGLFGSSTSSGLLGSLINSIFGTTTPTATGGVATGLGGYQHGTDYVPKTGLYQLHQGEKVTSVEDRLKGEKKDQSGTTNLTAFYIYAQDPLSFRDFVRRNPEAIIEAIGKDSRGAGTTRGIIKGVG